MFAVFFVEDNVDYYRSYYKEAIQNAIAMVEEELKDSPVKDLYLDKVSIYTKATPIRNPLKRS